MRINRKSNVLEIYQQWIIYLLKMIVLFNNRCIYCCEEIYAYMRTIFRCQLVCNPAYIGSGSGSRGCWHISVRSRGCFAHSRLPATLNVIQTY